MAAIIVCRRDSIKLPKNHHEETCIECAGCGFTPISPDATEAYRAEWRARLRVSGVHLCPGCNGHGRVLVEVKPQSYHYNERTIIHKYGATV